MTHMQKLLEDNARLRQRLHREATAVAVAYELPLPPAPEIPPVTWQAAVEVAEARRGGRMWKFFNPPIAWGWS